MSMIQSLKAFSSIGALQPNTATQEVPRFRKHVTFSGYIDVHVFDCQDRVSDIRISEAESHSWSRCFGIWILWKDS